MPYKKTNLRLPTNMKESLIYSLCFHGILILICLMFMYVSPPTPVVVQVTNISLAMENTKDTSAMQNNPNPFSAVKPNASVKPQDKSKDKEVKKTRNEEKKNPQDVKTSLSNDNNIKKETKIFDKFFSKSEPKTQQPVKSAEKPAVEKKILPPLNNIKSQPVKDTAAMVNSTSNKTPPTQAVSPKVQENPQASLNTQNPIAEPSEDIYIYDEKKEKKKEFEAKKKVLEESNFDDFLNQTIDSIEPTNDDILSSGQLTNQEKHIFQSQVKRCWIANDYIKEDDLIVTLKFKMSSNGNIESLIVDTSNIPDRFKQSVADTIESIFAQEECKKLLLPARKYNTWKEFSIKLTLKGFF